MERAWAPQQEALMITYSGAAKPGWTLAERERSKAVFIIILSVTRC